MIRQADSFQRQGYLSPTTGRKVLIAPFQGQDPTRVLSREKIPALMRAIQESGYRILGPTIRSGAIVHAEIETVDDLPIGRADLQEGGKYRLRQRDDAALFGYAVGPQSWKEILFPPSLLFWQGGSKPEGFAVERPKSEPARLALFGARPCDIAAIGVQDRTFRDGPYPDRYYTAQRASLFVVAIQCTDPGGTCFCVSMGTGPQAKEGFDLALTELLDGGGHRFLVEIGTEAGARVLAAASPEPARPQDREAAKARIELAATRMGRTFDNTRIRELLYSNLEHPRWDDVARRCLACTNCTLVCPTCFCSTFEDVTDLAGGHTERRRRWDSCYTLGHSYLHGGSVRQTHRSRYRQWLVHKVASWIDQFGVSGCVGCGRCITWCPVAIDLTEEVAAIRASPSPSKGA